MYMYLLSLHVHVATDVHNIVPHKLSPGNWIYQFIILVSILNMYL